MKTIFALLALFVSTAAFSACYLVYTPSNELVWRGTTAPIAMDTLSLDAEIQKKVPKGHLVINNNPAEKCPPLNLTAPKTTMHEMAEEMKYD